MSVDILTITYRNYKALDKCLNLVRERTKYVDYKHYVQCNDPDENIKKIIHNSIFVDDIRITDNIIPIFNDNNDGSFSSNNNELAAEGNGDYILFLNDDCFPINDSWLYNMTKIMDLDSNVGAVGALLFYPGEELIQHCGVFFSNKTNSLPFHMHYRQPISNVMNYVMKPRYYQAVTGACLLVRRSDFEKVGGFNTNYWYSYEDINLCLSIKELKRTIVYTPDAKLIHSEGISSSIKNNKNFQKNIDTFRKNCTGKYFNDLEFYLSNQNHMIYKLKKED